MALFQVEAEHLLDEGAEGHARIAEQPPGQLGIEEPPRPEANLGQAGQVLGRRVQHRLGIRQRGVDAGQIGAGNRVDKHRTRSRAAELDQVGALPVAVTRGALGVDRDGSLAPGQPADDLGQRGIRLDDRRQAVARLEQRDYHAGLSVYYWSARVGQAAARPLSARWSAFVGYAAARPLTACGHPCPGCRSARVPGGSSPAAADRQSHQAAMCADRSRASRSP